VLYVICPRFIKERIERLTGEAIFDEIARLAPEILHPLVFLIHGTFLDIIQWIALEPYGTFLSMKSACV